MSAMTHSLAKKMRKPAAMRVLAYRWHNYVGSVLFFKHLILLTVLVLILILIVLVLILILIVLLLLLLQFLLCVDIILLCIHIGRIPEQRLLKSSHRLLPILICDSPQERSRLLHPCFRYGRYGSVTVRSSR